MNTAIQKRLNHLPVNSEDMQKYILIGKAKVQANIEAIKAIKEGNIQMSAAAMQAALEDTQDLAEELLYAEAKLGSDLASISNKRPIRDGSQKKLSGSTSTLPENINKKQSHYAQTLSRNEDKIAQVVAEARKKGEVPVRQHVLKAINIHVAQSTGEREWFTPPEYIEAARVTMGSIDIDPASCEEANETVKAKRYYTAEQNGLNKKWKGNIWLNPPYDHPIVDTFCQTLVDKVSNGETHQACIIVNNITETIAGQRLLSACRAVCFPRGRVKFFNPTKAPKNSPLQGQMVVYFGQRQAKFVEMFEGFGACMKQVK